MNLQYTNVTAAHARNHSEYLRRCGLTVAIAGDPLYWWSMSVADDGRAALMVDAADLPTTSAEGILTHHSLTAAEVTSLNNTLPERWINKSTI